MSSELQKLLKVPHGGGEVEVGGAQPTGPSTKSAHPNLLVSRQEASLASLQTGCKVICTPLCEAAEGALTSAPGS